MEWLRVLVLAATWAAGMLAWAYIRRRKRGVDLRTVPWDKHLGTYVVVILLGVDFGITDRFGLRSLHGNIFLLLLGVNTGLAVLVFALRLLSPLNADRTRL